MYLLLDFLELLSNHFIGGSRSKVTNKKVNTVVKPSGFTISPFSPFFKQIT